MTRRATSASRALALCQHLQFDLLQGVSVCRGFIECADDPNFEPATGLLQYLQFTWLGTLQYINIKSGAPHFFRVPRVVMISRRFVLSAAADAADVPEGYALGNIVFGDYERDEEECDMTDEEVAKSGSCDISLLLMPIADVLIHPEYKHFKVKHSIALLKMVTNVQSKYMLPVCLPFKDFVAKNVDDKHMIDKYYHVDFTSEVPRDVVDESKYVVTLNMVPIDKCHLLDDRNQNKTVDVRLACSNSCGLRSGAPTVVHEHTGHWSIVSLAQGGSPCPDPLRSERSAPPPTHTMLYPYVPWITSAISGRTYSSFYKDDPFGYIMPRTYLPNKLREAKGWIGKWWMGGFRCYDRGSFADDLFRFYHEHFSVNPVIETYLTYYIELDAPNDVSVVCVKVGVPYRLAEPKVFELDTSSIKLIVKLKKFTRSYKFEVEAWGKKKG
ncbi:CLIP domain-containing serine protease B9-like [Pectinophora gossypiella]|uniref:CLIP domain-containing serine protease B9-like n=1 Tax=Pectinophora gossypiella TaxID=13191 RepID=UPI00214E681D|nr:CLIP domain-containing serine protease B9-like [Pectinophora gossypiella]